MEDEKRKKRNKKKKNKQNKTAEDVAAVGADENHVTNGENNQSKVSSESAETQNGHVDLNRHQTTNGTEGAILAEAEKQHLLQRKAIFEEIVKRLQNEKDEYIQKETTLQETVKQLQNERDSHIEKVATLEGTVKQLRNENDAHIQKEATLEDTIKQLRNENVFHIQKEGGLQMSIAKLQSEKNIWLKNEADLEAKISQLLDERVALNANGARLQEKIELLKREKDSWIQLESTSKETIASLNDDITQLQMQVVALEESRNSLLRENQQLKENLSSLQLQLQTLERSVSTAHSSDEIKKHTSEQEDFNSQIEGAFKLVDKLIAENVELVEKVNELSVKLDRQSVPAGPSSAFGSDPMFKKAGITEPMSESAENVPILSHKLESPEVVEEVREEGNSINSVNAEPAVLVPNSSEADDSGEIVQIPLDDNEVRDVESQVIESDEKGTVPLSDAPLVGAPFRLISFVARYVSGSDLVNSNSSSLGH